MMNKIESKESVEVSIMIPILNEEEYIESTVYSVINGTENIENMEFFLVDGGSTDKTLEILDKLSKKYSFIKVLHNEKKEIAPALNLAISESSAKYIVRMDAHADFPNGYVHKLVNALKGLPNDVVNVGGIIETRPPNNSLIAQSIAIVSSSKIGVGNTTFRTENITEPRYVNTVPFGAYRKEALKKVGCFSENVPTSEDLELGRKLLKAGMKILMLPDVKSTYISRPDIKSFLIQHFDNGRCVTKENRGGIQSYYFSLKDLFSSLKNKVKQEKIDIEDGNEALSFYQTRHYIPLFFSLYLIGLLFLHKLYLSSNTGSLFTIFYIPIIIYTIMICSFGFINAIKKMRPFLIIMLPIALLCLHLSYGFGSLYGIIQLIFPTLKSPSRK